MSNYQCGRRGPRSGAQCSKYWSDEHTEHHSMESGERWTDDDYERIRAEKREERQAAAQAVWDLVIADMKGRDALGAKKYGKRFMTDTDIDPIRYAYEEALDLAAYLRKMIYKRDGK